MPKFNELSEKQDRELVELLIGGSQAALGELYARYRKRLAHLCKQYLKNETDVENIIHDVFLRLWETRHLLNTGLSFSGYVQMLAKNSVMYMFRQSDIHSRFVQHVLINASDLTNETEDAVINNDYAKLLDELTESLPPGQKEIFRLNRIEGLTYKEVSELLQIPVENVRRQASRASKKIKDHLLKDKNIQFQTVINILVFFL